MYVVDRNFCRVQYFTSSGSFLGEWGTPGRGDGELYSPVKIAVGPDPYRNVYVVEAGNCRIQYFTPLGSFLGKWGLNGTSPAFIYEPRGVAVAPDGTVYVVDNFHSRVYYYSPTGAFRGEWDSLGSSWGVAVGPEGHVYVTYLGSPSVRRFTATGSLLGSWGRSGSGERQFFNAQGIAVSPGGIVAVADAWSEDEGNHRIQFFTASGSFLGTLGSWGEGKAEFDVPLDVAFGPGGLLYVADVANARIQYFRPVYEGE